MITNARVSCDITHLILDDHETFRREFAALDNAEGAEQLRAIWEPLAALLDVHAAAWIPATRTRRDTSTRSRQRSDLLRADRVAAAR